MLEIVLKDNFKLSNQLTEFLSFDNNTLKIKDNLILDTPLKVVINDDYHEDLKIVVGKNANLKIILEFISQEKSKNNYNVHLFAKENSHLTYLLITELISNDAVLKHHFEIDKDANIDLIGAMLSNILNANIVVDLIGQNANAQIKTIVLSSDLNKQIIDVNINHLAKNTIANMANIGIVNKQGYILLNGVAKIFKGMKESNSFQSLKGIITSNVAKIEVNPILLIDEYDVKAGHGATVGKVEEEVLFYLMSRGLSQQEAEKLVIYGVLQPVIDEITDEALKNRVTDLIDKRL